MAKHPAGASSPEKILAKWRAGGEIFAVQEEIRIRSRRGEVNELRELLDGLDGSPMGVGSFGASALHVAAGRGRAEALAELLARGADPFEKTTEGNTPLMMAASADCLACVRLLLAAGGARLAKVKTKKGTTALMDAALWGAVDCVKELLSEATARQADGDGATALMIAAHGGRADIVQMLLPLSDVQAKDKKGRTALDYGARGRDMDLTPLMAGADPSQSRSALFAACKASNPLAFGSVLKAVGLGQAVEWDEDGSLASWAARSGSRAILEMLVDHCDPSQLSQAAKRARKEGRDEIAKELDDRVAARAQRAQLEAASAEAAPSRRLAGARL